MERRARRLVPKSVVRFGTEFLVFGIKQAWACLFGGLMVAALLITGFWWPEDMPLARYDFLFLFALSVQIVFLATGFERPREALVILTFHAVGTAMEVFKTAHGSWVYPEASLIRIGEVPLFSGFMYGAVGSYLARVVRVFDFRFTRYPRRRWTVLLAVLIYLNFFTHHFGPDIRWGLFLGTAILFAPTVVHYRVWRWQHKMPLLLGFVLVAGFIFLAENIGTLTGSWLYPNQQEGWEPVPIGKFGSWLLLMILSWVLVTIIHAPRAEMKRADRQMLPLRL
ncbi:MAG: DUF817 domain-containing protein [Pseudomonadota bacterium]